MMADHDQGENQCSRLRASSVVPCQLAVIWAEERASAQAATSASRGRVGDVPGEALAEQHRPLQPGAVQPPAVGGGIDPRQLLPQPSGLGRRNGFGSRRRGVDVELVQHQGDAFGRWVLVIHQVADGPGEIDRRAPLGDGDVAPIQVRSVGQEQDAAALAVVVAVLAGEPAGPGWLGDRVWAWKALPVSSKQTTGRAGSHRQTGQSRTARPPWSPRRQHGSAAGSATAVPATV